MRITVLTVPDCPNAPVVQERITLALDGRTAHVELVEITDTEQAARWGMTGSPTVLVDGADPFAVPGAPPSVSCRLYRGADGRVQGAPSVEELRRALDAAERRPSLVVPDRVGRAGRGRLAPAERGLRQVQQAVLSHFAATGRAPVAADLESAATASGRAAGEVLAELAAEDFLTLDGQGRIRAAYPFSADPTAHQVELPGGVRVWSMCAIDALGIPVMLGVDAVITSKDPVTRSPVTVTASEGRMHWDPESAVVFLGQRSGTGAAADVCCDAQNFFTDRANAHAWARQHPDVTGQPVSQDVAEEIGAQTFGPLLGSDAGTGSCC